MMSSAYATKDFYLAAFLLAAGEDPIEYKVDGDQLVFHFHETTSVQSLVESYYGFTASVNPVVYGNALKTLKRVVYAYKDKERTKPNVTQQKRIP